MKDKFQDSVAAIASFEEIRDRCIRRENEMISRHLDVSVDIVLPVYNDAQNLEVLLQTVHETSLSHRLIIIDDGSTDPKTISLIEDELKNHPSSRLIRNERNLGNVASINRGLVVTRTPQIALISSDLILPSGWLERLVMPLIKDPTVASCTPFSNSGRAAAFPHMLEDNQQFMNRSIEEMDQVFQDIRSLYTTIPFGIDTCMAMSRQVIHEIGVFDQNTFSRGYGEEVDWSMRAVQAGYRHVLVENLYIEHHHTAGYRDENVQRLMQRHSKELRERYPFYETILQDFRQQDPVVSVRTYAFIRLTAPRVRRRTLIFQNDEGKGPESYIQDQIAERSLRSEVTLLCRYVRKQKEYHLEYRYENDIFPIAIQSMDDVFSVAKVVGINGILVNQLAGYPDIREHLHGIRKLAEDTGASLITMIHDYLPICPRRRLISAWNMPCDVPTLQDCEQCMVQSGLLSSMGFSSLTEWRQEFRSFLSACHEVRVFSQDTMRLLQKALGTMERLHLMPERHSLLDGIHRFGSYDETVRLGIIGDITEAKGASLLKQMAQTAKKEKLPLELELLGKTDERIYTKNFHQEPITREEEIPGKVIGRGIDGILIPSQYPEPFSYTTQQGMELELPTISLPLGAPMERLQRYEKGLVLPSMQPQNHLDEILGFLQRYKAPVTSYPKEVLLLESSTRTPLEHYRAVQMREQLQLLGVNVQLLAVEKVLPKQVRNYPLIILMECPWTKWLKRLMDDAKLRGARIWYQIDTVSFDAGYINEYAAMTPEEREEAETKAEALSMAMEMTDGILVPTETMAGVMKRDFPGKSVRVWQGKATYGLRAIARKERLRPRPEGDTVRLGFVSSRHYGAYELQTIVRKLTAMMGQNPSLQLVILGEMAMPKELKGFSSQVKLISCHSFQEYLTALRETDIHLMPLADTLSSRNLVSLGLMMASLLQIPTISTDSREARRLIYSGQDGLLCQTEEDLEEAIDLLSLNAARRRSLGENAYYRIVEERSTELLEAEVKKILE